MNFDKTPNNYAVIVFSVMLLIPSAAQVVSAQSELYDDFNGNLLLNPDKWAGFNSKGDAGSTLELSRRVQGAHLVLSQQVYGGSDYDAGEYFQSNALTAPIHPKAFTIHGFFRELEMLGCSVPDSSVHTFGLLRIANPIFNTGNGDVHVWFDVSRYAIWGGDPNQLSVTAILFNTSTSEVLGILELGIVRIGQRFTLWMEWLPDSDEVRFRLNNDPIGSITYNLPDETPPWEGLTIYTEAGASNCTEEQTFSGMEVHIDDVYINR